MRLGKAALLLISALALHSPILLNCVPEGNLPNEISEGKVAVMFWSELCSTCEEVMPYWAELERDPPEGVKVIDVELIPGRTDELFLELGIRETPTFILFVDGKEVKRFSGRPEGDPRKSLRDWLEDEGASLLGEAASLSLLGGMISLSPCSLPIMISLSSLARLSGRRSYALCFPMTVAGVLALGSIVLIASALTVCLLGWAKLLLAAVSIGLGLYSVILPQRACKLPERGIVGRLGRGPLACFTAGFLMVQCNFPLLTGSLILLGSMKDVLSGVIGLVSLSMSLSLVLMLLTATSRRLAASFTAGAGRANATRVGGILLTVLGLYIMLSSLGIIR
ncbi:MAG: thioredoxin family protein [Candidatus Korarchaeum sp.]